MDPDSTAGPLVDERRWKGANLTAILGTSAVVIGGLLLVAGWYGVSGEAIVAKQLPYLASASIPGAALVVVGAVLLAPVLRGATDNVDVTEQLLTLLTEPVPEDGRPAAGTPVDDGRLLAVPTGTHYHRPSCALVVGKPDARPVDRAAVAERSLQPCLVCRPEPPAGPDPTD
jgi:hypothetical protein